MLTRIVSSCKRVRIALGTITPEQAVAFLTQNVPMDEADARTEVVEMGELPGQKIAYQTGKLQIVQMVEDARLKQGDTFSVRKFHFYAWLNGNVPIALIRWEFLGMNDQVDKLSELK